LGPGGTGINVVSLSGEIKQGDETVFAALPTTYSLVTLSSDGGQAVAAMLIGETIRQRGWSTAVIHSTCASSCALIWLGGTRRFVTRDAMVGFHGAYDAVTHAVSGPANAVIGMYMHELGLVFHLLGYLHERSCNIIRGDLVILKKALALGKPAEFFPSIKGNKPL